MDEEEVFGGMSKGPSPLALFMASICGGINNSLVLTAREQGIDILGANWMAVGVYDAAGKLLPGHATALQEIRVVGRVERACDRNTGEDLTALSTFQDKLPTMVQLDRDPVTEAVTRAGIKLNLDLGVVVTTKQS